MMIRIDGMVVVVEAVPAMVAANGAPPTGPIEGHHDDSNVLFLELQTRCKPSQNHIFVILSSK